MQYSEQTFSLRIINRTIFGRAALFWVITRPRDRPPCFDGVLHGVLSNLRMPSSTMTEKKNPTLHVGFWFRHPLGSIGTPPKYVLMMLCSIPYENFVFPTRTPESSLSRSIFKIWFFVRFTRPSSMDSIFSVFTRILSMLYWKKWWAFYYWTVCAQALSNRPKFYSSFNF
jgi:hypothetical protein